ncbi:hypothetical protein [uncultured Rhodospira sp.]|uniref:hypothetical protein n=1 Tax=uncultured Rhodospira sp. TaxID=1936189 RepID=UPI00260BCF0C|nr:hypothetical protein [uncultured Rhodospira sp.]
MAEVRSAVSSAFALPEYVREISESHQDVRALRLALSELRPDSWDTDVIQALDQAIQPLARSNGVRVFRLPGKDYLICFHRDQTDAVRSLLIRMRLLIPDDPLTAHLLNPAGQNSPLLTWWSLDRDFAVLRSMAKRIEAVAMAKAETAAAQSQTKPRPDYSRSAAFAEGKRAETAPQRPQGIDDEAPDGPPPGLIDSTGSNRPAGSDRQPLDADILDRLISGLNRADLSNHVRLQTICAVVGGAPPQSLYSEIYVSIPKLRDTVAPQVDLTANRWLFQHFTETLDRRILSWLNHEGPRLIRGGFAININVGSILSDAFLRFEERVAAALHGTAVLELRVEDVFADLEAFTFARDFLHQRGYRICLDSLSPEEMALLNRERLGVDMMKLFWRPDLPELLSQGPGAELAERLRDGEGATTILARCDDPAAIDLGKSLGITMFQGHHMDKLLAGGGGR